MPYYTVCPNLIKFCGKNTYYLLNILYVFLQDNPNKIAKDANRNSKVLQDIHEIAENFAHISEWARILDKVRPFVKIKIPKKEYNGLELYVAICENTVGERILLTNCKQDYKKYLSHRCEIIILDEEEAKDRLTINANIYAYDKSAVVVGSKKIKLNVKG